MALIILAGRHVLVESGLHDLGSYVTPVVPEFGGEGKLSRRNSPPSISFPVPSG
jgi:hypothetical protein